MAERSTDLSMSETQRNPIHSSMYSSHSRNHVEGVSVEVCNIMTQLGYGEEIRRRRVEKYRVHDMLIKSIEGIVTLITAGSKAEGLTSCLESDIDWLYLLNNVVCVETGVDLHTIPDDIEVYRMDTDVYPGHCKMLLERPASTRLICIHNALCNDGKENTLLSSSLVLDEVLKHYTHVGVPHERAGPSLPVSAALGMNIDTVLAIRCQCPGIIQRWAQRSRQWPPPDVVQQVATLGSVVTPLDLKPVKTDI